jgi:general secretion pathway protein A
MYNAHFGFSEHPFSIAPDPRYLYMSERHREALAHLLYGVESDGGFVLLTGEVGTGKTTVCRCLLEQLPEHCDVAFILNPKLTVPELLSTVCDEFGISYPPGTDSVKIFTDLINAFLLDAHAKGRKTVLIIDEAQNLSSDVLEQMRLLTNLETNQRKLLQIILLGQPELRDMLARTELRQLAQRIIARYHLDALSREETEAYVNHRIAVAGCRGELLPRSALNRLYQLSGGIPRLINVLADRALLGAYVQGKTKIDRKTLAKAATEVFGEGKSARTMQVAKWMTGLFILGLAGAGTYFFYSSQGTVPAKSTHLPVAKTYPSKPAQPSTPLASIAWPSDQPIEQSEARAFQAVFHLWGADWPESGNNAPCVLAEARQLRCFADRSGLDALRRLNRPAVVKLYNAEGRPYFAALTKLDDHSATLLLGTEARAVAMETLALAWRGEFTLLWRLPPGYQSSLRPGSRQPAVAWLDKLLAQYFHRPLHAGAPLYDDAMVKEVKRFQLSVGLQPDGEVGTSTWICLENVTAGGVPLLHSTAQN